MPTLKAKKKPSPKTRRNARLVPLPEEALLTIEVDGRTLSRLSCSPFDRRELVLGWLFSQGLLQTPGDAAALRFQADRALVRLRPTAAPRLEQYHPVQVVACSGGDVQPGLFSNPPKTTRKYAFTLPQAIRLMEQLPGRTPLFKKHGGIHCSMLADMREQSILVSREDISRSNSVDKVIGWGLVHGADFSRTALFITGRVSAEMALKVLHAGIPALVSQTTLTGKALEIVRQSGLTLIGHVLKPRPILLNF
ncbi:MAG: formate dehydrogenase accessory sulfurtransferase FdhD [Candidatus Aminicenantes bacterium]|nr:formate dehydrogenase accessory sulfurtransferase FdhD [Candidatus Aminicenantes bacterium]